MRINRTKTEYMTLLHRGDDGQVYEVNHDSHAVKKGERIQKPGVRDSEWSEH